MGRGESNGGLSRSEAISMPREVASDLAVADDCGRSPNSEEVVRVCAEFNDGAVTETSSLKDRAGEIGANSPSSALNAAREIAQYPRGIVTCIGQSTANPGNTFCADRKLIGQ